MRAHKRIAILTASFGAGHFKAAQAIEQAIAERDAAAQSKLIDSFIATAPRMTGAAVRLYLRVLSRVPSIYGMLYAWGNRSRAALWLRKLLSFRLSVSTRRQLAAFSPHAVICTHASPMGAVCRLKKQGSISAPLIAVITDFVVHRLWIFDEVDIYSVAHEGAARQLLAAGVAPDKILVSGIPIAGNFRNPVAKMNVREQLGLADDMPAVLLMGGGAGALPMDKIVAEFKHNATPVQLLVVAGHNEQLRARLKDLAESMPIRVFGFVDNIHELMAAADLIVTKPGGLSTAEALAMGVPMVLFRPIPGQEEGNARFLVNEGVACRVDNMKDLPAMVINLLQDHEQLNMMRGRALEIAKPQAAQRVADMVAGLCAKSR